MKTDERIAVSVVLEPELIAKLDELAKAQDMNRSQLIRRIAREALAKTLPTQSQPEPAAA